MSNLSGFAKSAKGRPDYNQARSSGLKHLESDPCPAGYDADVWRLAKMFRQYAWNDRIELAHGLPIIYIELAKLVDRYGIRHRSLHQEVEGCEHRDAHSGLASRCWYHFPPHDPGKQETRALRWFEVVEVIMAEFWSRIQDRQALARFPQYFGEYGQAAVNHWNNLETLRQIREQHKDEPRRPRMRRVNPGGTMADASKEG